MRRLLSALLLSAATAAVAEPMTDASTRALAVDILRELVEINTTESAGSVTRAAKAMAARFRAAGFADADIVLAGDNPRKQNLVVRLHGTGRKPPLLLLGHLDVVEAGREGWTTDPFKFVEKDGYYYGRGTSDMKDGDAVMAATLIRLKQAGIRARSRRHSGADRGRRERRLERRRVAAVPSTRTDRRALRPQPGRHRGRHAQRQGRGGERRPDGKDLCGF